MSNAAPKFFMSETNGAGDLNLDQLVAERNTLITEHRHDLSEDRQLRVKLAYLTALIRRARRKQLPSG